MIDHGMFPHIMDAILEYSDLTSLVRLASTSQDFREKAMDRACSHLVCRSNLKIVPVTSASCQADRQAVATVSRILGDLAPFQIPCSARNHACEDHLVCTNLYPEVEPTSLTTCNCLELRRALDRMLRCAVLDFPQPLTVPRYTWPLPAGFLQESSHVRAFGSLHPVILPPVINLDVLRVFTTPLPDQGEVYAIRPPRVSRLVQVQGRVKSLVVFDCQCPLSGGASHILTINPAVRPERVVIHLGRHVAALPLPLLQTPLDNPTLRIFVLIRGELFLNESAEYDDILRRIFTTKRWYDSAAPSRGLAPCTIVGDPILDELAIIRFTRLFQTETFSRQYLGTWAREHAPAPLSSLLEHLTTQFLTRLRSTQFMTVAEYSELVGPRVYALETDAGAISAS